ncbi:hypothetical protein GQ457_18G009580 [Hibiscus cannabinus]
MQLVTAQQSDTPSASSFQLIEAPFSSTSALLAQLKLNNPEVAETYPTQGRVSYGHVDSMWGVLPFLYACAQHVMASGACAMHTGQHVQRMCILTHAKHERAYISPRSVTYKEAPFSFSLKYADVSTSSSAHVADLEVLPQGPVTRSKAKQFKEVLSLTCAKLLDSFDNVCALDRERTCAQELKSSLVEARKLVCSSFQLNEATTPSASSFQLTSAPSSSTSAPLAQLKLNNSEVAESVLRQLEIVLREGRVSRDMCRAHGQHVPCTWNLHTCQACGWPYQPLSLFI